MNQRVLGVFLVVLGGILAGCKEKPPRQPPVPEEVQGAPTASAIAARSPQPEPGGCPANLPQFKDYPVDSIFRGEPKWPAVTLGPDSEDLGNRPEAALAHVKDRTPDFAGYLHVVESGCGAPCQVQQLVDVRRGEVVATATTSLGAAYRADSRLFVVNPMDSTGCYDETCAYCRPRYFVWNGQGLDSIW